MLHCKIIINVSIYFKDSVFFLDPIVTVYKLYSDLQQGNIKHFFNDMSDGRLIYIYIFKLLQFRRNPQMMNNDKQFSPN